ELEGLHPRGEIFHLVPLGPEQVTFGHVDGLLTTLDEVLLRVRRTWARPDERRRHLLGDVVKVVLDDAVAGRGETDPDVIEELLRQAQDLPHQLVALLGVDRLPHPPVELHLAAYQLRWSLAGLSVRLVPLHPQGRVVDGLEP